MQRPLPLQEQRQGGYDYAEGHPEMMSASEGVGGHGKADVVREVAGILLMRTKAGPGGGCWGKKYSLIPIVFIFLKYSVEIPLAVCMHSISNKKHLKILTSHVF